MEGWRALTIPPRGPLPAARRWAPLAELLNVNMEGIWGPGCMAVKIKGEGSLQWVVYPLALCFHSLVTFRAK